MNEIETEPELKYDEIRNDGMKNMHKSEAPALIPY